MGVRRTIADGGFKKSRGKIANCGFKKTKWGMRRDGKKHGAESLEHGERQQAPAFAKATARQGRQRSEVRSQRSEDRRQKAEDGVDAVSCQWSVVRCEKRIKQRASFDPFDRLPGTMPPETSSGQAGQAGQAGSGQVEHGAMPLEVGGRGKILDCRL